MRGWRKVLYWGVTVGLLGFGLVGIMSIGLIFLVAGAALAGFGVFMLGTRGLWAAVVGFGGIPALVFLANLAFTFFVADPSCSGVLWGNSTSVSGSVSLAPGEESVTCSMVPGSYVVLLGISLLIALSGLGWKAFWGTPA